MSSSIFSSGVVSDANLSFSFADLLAFILFTNILLQNHVQDKNKGAEKRGRERKMNDADKHRLDIHAEGETKLL
jgi:hypothetical protein